MHLAGIVSQDRLFADVVESTEPLASSARLFDRTSTKQWRGGCRSVILSQGGWMMYDSMAGLVYDV